MGSKHASNFLLLCSMCTAQKNWTYGKESHGKYTKNVIPFKEIIIDMVGPVEAKTRPKSKKVYPVLVKCLQTGVL